MSAPSRPPTFSSQPQPRRALELEMAAFARRVGFKVCGGGV
jgi:hypothetical protein